MSCWKRCVVCFLLGWKTALHGPTSQRDIPGRSFRLGFLICLSLIYTGPKPPNAVGQTLIHLLCKCWARNSRPSLPQKSLSKALGHWWTFFTYFEVFRKGIFFLTSLPVYLLRTTRRKPPNFRKIEKKLLIWKEVPELPFQFQFCNGFQFKNPLPDPQGDRSCWPGCPALRKASSSLRAERPAEISALCCASLPGSNTGQDFPEGLLCPMVRYSESFLGQ